MLLAFVFCWLDFVTGKVEFCECFEEFKFVFAFYAFPVEDGVIDFFKCSLHALAQGFSVDVLKGIFWNHVPEDDFVV